VCSGQRRLQLALTLNGEPTRLSFGRPVQKQEVDIAGIQRTLEEGAEAMNSKDFNHDIPRF
jgi:hypothetical protein